MIRFRLEVFFHAHRRKILAIAASSVLIVLVAVFAVPPVVRAVSERVEHRRAVNRFNNLSNEDFIYDFEYLMQVLEENWPFFNLSVSANGVDVRELADNVRAVLHGPGVGDPFEFLDMMRAEFFGPIGQLGHLWPIPGYDYFYGLQQWVALRRSPWQVSRMIEFIHELISKSEVVMFYTMLRYAQDDVSEPEEPEHGPVKEVFILDEGKTAMLRINRMIHFLHDINVPNRRMGYYEAMLYEFYGSIEGFEHFLIDFRGNRGGMHTFFDVFVVPPLLYERIYMSGYVFYMGGEYSIRAKETFDSRLVGYIEDINVLYPAYIYEPLPYLDMNIDFTYVYSPFYSNSPARYFHERWISLRDERVFDGKVWLLTDRATASAAEAAVAKLKYSNFAIVVGEVTRGMMGITYMPTRTMLSLPNTGILIYFDVAYFTDIYGRPLQGYGIMPHYFNRPGMDALETVLAMIAER